MRGLVTESLGSNNNNRSFPSTLYNILEQLGTEGAAVEKTAEKGSTQRGGTGKLHLIWSFGHPRTQHRCTVSQYPIKRKALQLPWPCLHYYRVYLVFLVPQSCTFAALNECTLVILLSTASGIRTCGEPPTVAG